MSGNKERPKEYDDKELRDILMGHYHKDDFLIYDYYPRARHQPTGDELLEYARERYYRNIQMERYYSRLRWIYLILFAISAMMTLLVIFVLPSDFFRSALVAFLNVTSVYQYMNADTDRKRFKRARQAYERVPWVDVVP